MQIRSSSCREILGRVIDIPVLMAGSLVSAIPAVVVYLIFQRQLVNGLTAGIGK